MPNQNDYFAGMSQGKTGRALAEAAGIQVPEGMSPPIVTPAPVMPPTNRWISGAQPRIEADINTLMSTLPVDEAKRGASAALQYMAINGFNRDISIGTPHAVAMQKWFPMMLGGKAGTSGVMKSLQPDSTELITKDIGGGKKAVYRPGGTTLQVVGTDTSLSEKDKLAQLSRKASILRALEDINPASPGYSSLTNSLSELDRTISQSPTVPAPVVANDIPVDQPIETKEPQVYIGSREGYQKPVAQPVKVIQPAQPPPQNKRFRYNPNTRKLEPVR